MKKRLILIALVTLLIISISCNEMNPNDYEKGSSHEDDSLLNDLPEEMNMFRITIIEPEKGIDYRTPEILPDENTDFKMLSKEESPLITEVPENLRD